VAEATDLRRIRRGCTDKGMRGLVLAAIDTGARYKMTKSGVMFHGEDGGGATAHFTVSDHRAVENFRRTLRSIGITIEKRK
jgi:hypothetical protein